MRAPSMLPQDNAFKQPNHLLQTSKFPSKKGRSGGFAAARLLSVSVTVHDLWRHHCTQDRANHRLLLAIRLTVNSGYESH
jgi:hypothetical protein